jgi:hypothetical protein
VAAKKGIKLSDTAAYGRVPDFAKRLGDVQAQGFGSDFIEHSFAVLLRDYPEATRIVPHGPTDVVALEGCTCIFDP